MNEVDIFWIGFALGGITLVMGLIVGWQARGWWRRRRYGNPVNHGLLLVEYGRRLTEMQDRQALVNLLINDLPKRLSIQRSELLFADEYQLSSTGENEGHLNLPISHAAVRWVASSGEAQKATQGQLLKLIQQGRTDLTWTQVWVPLMRGTRLRGMWLLGTRYGQVQYSPEDLRFLTSIAREVTAVLETMTYADQERQSALEIRTLYRQLVTAREEEWNRLTRELHDGVLQDLCAIVRDLKALKTQSDGDDFSGLVNLSGNTVNALRAICNNLRSPLLQQDLIAALKALVQELDLRSTAPIHIEVQVQDFRLDDETVLAMFRITQEALNNAIQHADASEIAVRLTQYPDRLRLTVTDDGRGITGSVGPARFVAQGHFGLAGMRERAAMVGGKLDVQTAVEYGTVVIFELPL